MRRTKPGARWRILVSLPDGTELAVKNVGEFDEIVVDRWLHVERMDTRAWWAQIGDFALWIKIDRDGYGVVTMTEHRPKPEKKQAARRGGGR